MEEARRELAKRLGRPEAIADGLMEQARRELAEQLAAQSGNEPVRAVRAAREPSSVIPIIPLPDVLKPTRPPAGSPL